MRKQIGWIAAAALSVGLAGVAQAVSGTNYVFKANLTGITYTQGIVRNNGVLKVLSLDAKQLVNVARGRDRFSRSATNEVLALVVSTNGPTGLIVWDTRATNYVATIADTEGYEDWIVTGPHATLWSFLLAWNTGGSNTNGIGLGTAIAQGTATYDASNNPTRFTVSINGFLPAAISNQEQDVIFSNTGLSTTGKPWILLE